MPTTTVSIGFRPPRIATLIRAGSLRDLAAAVAANTQTWGGIYNPIIAVGDSPETAVNEVTEFRVDLVTVLEEPTPAQTAVLEANRHLEYRRLMRDPFEQHGAGGMPFADSRLICRHYYETTFRFGVTPSNAVYVSWAPDDAMDAYLSVMFGKFRPDAAGERFRRAFVEGLAAETIDRDSLARAVTAVTQIQLTGTYLSAYPARRAHGVVIGSVESVEALLHYWNLRSVGCSVAFWPTDGPQALLDFAVAGAERVLEQSAGEPGFISIWRDDQFSEPLPAQLQVMLEQSGSSIAKERLTPAVWRSDECGPCVWAAPEKAVLGRVEPNAYGKTELVAELPPSPFYPAEPQIVDGAQWLVTIKTNRPDNLGRFTFDIPRIATLTPWASDQLHVLRDVRLEDRGVSLFSTLDDTSLTLQLVERRAVIARLFEEAGFKAEMSPAGVAADRIVTRMGGLWRCRSLRLHGLRRILASGSRAWSWRAAMSALHDGGAYSRYRNVPPAPELLRSVIARGALQAVLTIQCPSCSVRSDYRLSDINEEMRCLRCNQPFDLAPLLERAGWRYRPSGFFETLTSHGALPVVLSMLRLVEAHSFNGSMIEASFNLADSSSTGECDVVALWRDREGHPVMLVGECKGGPELVDAGDAAFLGEVANAVRKLGMECYLMFATTRESFSDGELAIFRELRDEHAHESSLDHDHRGTRGGPLLLAADQLDYHDFVPITFDGMPIRYVHDIASLALNSQALAFDLGLAAEVRAHREKEGRLI